MSDILLTSVVVILALAFVYFGGRLAWLLIRVVRVLWLAHRDAARELAALRVELASMPTDAVRQRLLTDAYFEDALRAQAPVAAFLARVAAGDEVTLRAEYSQRGLYRMLVGAERTAGILGRPLAMEAIDELDAILDELATRGRRTSAS